MTNVETGRMPTQTAQPHMIITGASPAYEASVLALVGSLNANWPGHPPVMVYDLGMSSETVAELEQAGVPVRRVPAFCPHWRRFFTWKYWCFSDVPAETYLWIDAGACLLRPMPEAFVAADALGYFCSTNHCSQKQQTSPAAARALSLKDAAMADMASINSGIHAIHKHGPGLDLLREVMALALVEDNLHLSNGWHRNDQTFLTALLYRYFGQPLFADFLTYAGWQSPREVLNQKIWVHRRRMLAADLAYFRRALSEPLPPHIPASPPIPPPDSWIKKVRIRIATWRGRYPATRSGEFIPDGVKD